MFDKIIFPKGCENYPRGPDISVGKLDLTDANHDDRSASFIGEHS